MSSLTKDIQKLNLFPDVKKNKFINRPHARLGRVKIKDDKKNIIDPNSLYSKDPILSSILDKNIMTRKQLNRFNDQKLDNLNSFSYNEKEKIIVKKKKLLFNKINSITNKEKYTTGNIFNKAKLKTLSAKEKDIKIDKNNFFLEKLKKNSNIFDDNRIKNINSLWNELEVLSPYRKYFFFIYKEISEAEKENLYQNEINELIELKNDIKNMTYNIELRTGIIKKLSELNYELNNEIQYNINNNMKEFIINEMENEILKLTEQTVNIVKYMKKIKILLNTISNLGKYSIQILSKKFDFDINYIIKMKAETNFLHEGNGKLFLNIKNEDSPFFVKILEKYRNSHNESDVKILEQNIIDNIKECSYYIYQELIAYQNEKANKNVFRCISPLRRNNRAYNYENINFS